MSTLNPKFMTNLTVTTDLEHYRQQFPALAHKAYFNFGGQGTMPQAALDTIFRSYELIQQQGPFSVEVNRWIAEQGQKTRAAIASELGATPETITLTENVTQGCNIPLWGINWEAGDRILLTDCEHPGVIATVQEIARRYRVEIATAPILATLNSSDPVAVLEQHLTPNTRLIVLSHLLWNTGQVLPLDGIIALCRAYNSRKPLQILVDAAQSAGSLPLNLTELGIDFYAFTGHKWMCGPAGVGGLYISPEARETIAPTFIGWRSITMDAQGNPTGWKADGQRFEVATSAFPQYAGLEAAIATHQSWGNRRDRYAQICKNSEYLWNLLQTCDRVHCLKTTPPQSGLVSFTLDGLDPKAIVQKLETEGFLLRTLLHPDCIRACVHYFTSTGEMNRLVATLQRFVQT
jgi:L-cysteine/cystine lyase